MLVRRLRPWGDMWTEMNRLQNEMNKFFDAPDRTAFFTGRGRYPAVNVWEDDDKLYVESELPGLALDDLEIYVERGDELTIKGERKEPETGKGAWHRRERGYGAFQRTLSLPIEVDADHVEAHFKDGVLTVELPKRKEVKPRRIEIKQD